MLKFLRTQGLALLLIVMMAFFLLLPIVSNQIFPSTIDFANHLVMIMQATLALHQGQFPLRVAPLEQLGWQYPYFQFYSPTVYLLTAFISQLTHLTNPLWIYKLVIVGFEIIGGWYVYRLADKWVRCKPAALLAAMVYVLAPFNMTAIEYWGMLSQALCIAWMPVVVYYSIDLWLHERWSSVLLLSFAWYVCLTLHLITYVYLSMFLGLFFLMTLQKSRVRALELMVLAYLWAIALGLWHLAPIANLHQFLTVSSAFHLMPIYMAKEAKFYNILIYLNAPILFALLYCLYQLACQPFKKWGWMSACLSVALIAFFIVCSPINFWVYLPTIFLIAESSERLLPFVILPGALLFAWMVKPLLQQPQANYFFACSALALFSLSGGWLLMPDTQYLSTQKLMQNPNLIYNVNSYIIYPKKYPYFVTVDSVQINSLFHDGAIIANQTYTIPKVLLSMAASPELILQGVLPASSQGMAEVYANNQLITSFQLQPGSYHWVIPLPKADTNFYIHAASNIPVAKVILGGYLNTQHFMLLDKVEKHCHIENQDVLCQLDIPANIREVELPLLFYPEMLNITINNKTVPYYSVLHENRALVMIKPSAGQNEIRMRFTGLEWANQGSELAWLMWACAWVGVWKRKRSFFLG